MGTANKNKNIGHSYPRLSWRPGAEAGKHNPVCGPIWKLFFAAALSSSLVATALSKTLPLLISCRRALGPLKRSGRDE